MLKHILIVDDNTYKRANIRGYIEKISNKLDVQEVNCINEGLAYIARTNKEDIKKNPNEWLVITDMVMPLMNGTNLIPNGGMRILRELNRLKFSCPIIVQSSEEVDLDSCKKEYDNVIGTVLELDTVYNLSNYKKLVEQYL